MKKRFIITIVVGIIFGFSLFTVLHFYANKDTKVVLKSEKYQVTRTFEKGEEVEGYTYKGNCTIYQNSEITVFVYEYNDFNMAEREIKEYYNQEKEAGVIIDFVSKDNYIKKELCYDDEICSISIGNEKYYLAIFFEKSNTKKVYKLLQKMALN